MAMKIRWTVGDRFLDIVTNQIATIIALPESKRDKRRVFAEWMDGSRDWVDQKPRGTQVSRANPGGLGLDPANLKVDRLHNFKVTRME